MSAAHEKPVFDFDTMPTHEKREIWPNLQRYLEDPCGSCLTEDLQHRFWDEDSRRDRYRRRKAKHAIASEARGMLPR